MVLFDVDGRDPGAEFPADGQPRRAHLTAWSGPLPQESLVSVQVVRNGEIVQAWDLRSKRARQWSGEFELTDTAFAWYAIRVISAVPASGQSTETYSVAVASPVYFLPKNFHRPQPAVAKVRLKLADPQNHPLAATVHVIDAGKEIAQIPGGSSGEATFQAPPTAALSIRAPDHAEAKVDLFSDSPLVEACRDFHGFYSPSAYHKIRTMIGDLNFKVTLEPVHP